MSELSSTLGLPPHAFWHALADAADRETLRWFRGGGLVGNKRAAVGDFDPVTEGDRAAERAIRQLLAEHYPDHAVLGEEEGESGNGAWRWVIDPIDGTRAFVAGLPTWMTLIGLEHNGRAVAGLASQPVTGERFVALGDGKAVLSAGGETRALQTSNQSDPSHAIVMTTDPYLFGDDTREGFERMRRGPRLLRFGTDAYAFCALAAGTVDIAFEANVAPYDIGALIPIVEAAGGVFTTWTGARPEGGGHVVASANPLLHDWALSQLAHA